MNPSRQTYFGVYLASNGYAYRDDLGDFKPAVRLALPTSSPHTAHRDSSTMSASLRRASSS